jgi:hypothetical protein
VLCPAQQKLGSEHWAQSSTQRRVLDDLSAESDHVESVSMEELMLEVQSNLNGGRVNG